MKETGGFCLPDFVKKGKNIWFAIDNIDLLEDTPTGQNTFHGTVIVINQRAEDGEPVNQPLVIPEKLLSQAPLEFEVKYMEEQIIRTKPVRFAVYHLGKRNRMISKDFTHTWALANYLATDDNRGEIPNNPHVEDDEQHDIEAQQDQSDCENTRNPDNSILSVQPRIPNGGKLAKDEVMSTWAATNSLLLSQSSQSHGRTNTEVIAPLFRTSPTDYATLHTVLMLTQGISAVVVGSERRTIITLDLDLYNRALRLQQSVGNCNWILRAGVLHIAFAALHALGKTIDGSGIDTCAIECGTYTSAALRGIYGGKAFKRGVEYHVTTSLAIMMMMFDSILSDVPHANLRGQCSTLKKALHERSPDMVENFNDIHSWYSTNLKEKTLESSPSFLCSTSSRWKSFCTSLVLAAQVAGKGS